MENTETIYIKRIAEEATRRGIENISQYLLYAYTIGFENGRKDKENTTPVVRTDSTDKETIFPSASSAARSTCVTHPTILEACKKGHKVKGFEFRKL